MNKYSIGILIAAFVIIACLIPACRTSEEVILYEITGPPSWTISLISPSVDPCRWRGVLTGDFEIGTASPASPCWGCGEGFYRRTDNDIYIKISWPTWPSSSMYFHGTIASGQAMGGTWSSSSGSSGTWVALR